MLDSYLGAGIMLLMAIGIAVGMVVMTSILGPKREFADKMEPFECGESPTSFPSPTVFSKILFGCSSFRSFRHRSRFLFSLGNPL